MLQEPYRPMSFAFVAVHQSEHFYQIFGIENEDILLVRFSVMCPDHANKQADTSLEVWNVLFILRAVVLQ